jgi:hypothetical protein
MFSNNTREEVKEGVMHSLDIGTEARNEKYLGLPIYMRKSKVQTFSYIKDKVRKRIQGWKEKLLSRAGMDVLIKAVAQSIPTYAMSCFDLTKTLCDDIGMMIARFWCAQQENENKLHWISWERMCSRKEKGGLGYRDLHLFNLAMLARQGWRLLMEPESLCTRVLKAKYYPDGDLLKSEEKPGISYSRRSIVRGLKAIKQGMIRRVGDGTMINIWGGPWLPRGTTRRPCTPRGATILTKVSDLIDPYTGTWDKELIQDIFWPEDMKLILAIPIKHGEADTPAWHYDSKGFFSVKSAYHVLEDNREHEQERQKGETSSSTTSDVCKQWKRLWNFKCQPKVKQFFWRFAHNGLALLSIKRRGVMDVDTRCPVCNRLDEDGGHCFLKCKIVRKCWQALNLERVRMCLLGMNSPRDIVQHILTTNEKEKVLISCILWSWWDARNKANAGEGLPVIEDVHHKAIEAEFNCDLRQRTTAKHISVQPSRQQRCVLNHRMC